MFVPVAPNGGVGDGTIPTAELGEWDVGDGGPELLRSVEVEALVQVDPYPKSTLVDLEETPQPRTEEPHHARIGVGELDLAIALRPFARMEGDACSKERFVAEYTEAGDAIRVQLLDLTQLGLVRRLGRRCAPMRRGDGVNSTSRTQTDTDDLLTPSSVAMSRSVSPCARSSRARACSSTSPRYPTR